MILRRPQPNPPGLEPHDLLYARAMQIAVAPARRTALAMRLLNLVYVVSMMTGAGWLFAMAIDRSPPIELGERLVITPRVRPGEQLLVRVTRTRLRQCEFTRTWSIVDGSGRRTDFERRFEAYGELHVPDTDSQGPIVPRDAIPGRGRFVSVLSWDCNPLQRALGWSIVLVLPPLEFEIAPRD